MIRVDLVIGFIALGVSIGVLTTVVITKIKQNKPMPTEPVVCIVKLQSGPIGTHNFKGVVK